ncbi:phosphatase domain-containing protein [Tabrizicola thermarum]|uniref:phosphatase domain-containing protein n=1 Tax=Tabrizicola thermarum TaxID=2670345 RepID=UPI000FFC30A7|nr:tyrosine-protein phosphatase [Tabrizicola thermarum]
MGRTRRVLRGGLGVGAAAVVALLVHLGYLALSGNFHPVIADEVYRSAQVSKADIADYRARYGIRSILNLRGASPGQPWYDEEVAASAALGITHADFAMNASVPLSEAEAGRLIALMRDLPKPLLVHCRHGADRTGLAMSLYLAAISGADEATAERQLSLRFGHFAVPVLSDAWPMDETWERLEPSLGFEAS